MSSSHANRLCRVTSRRAGFTLVELLVVIGIIALLISILLPSLNAARQQAQTIKCLSNLRQIGVAMAAYSSTNKGILLPSDVMDDKYPGTLTNSAGTQYQDTNETWTTILVADGYLSYPEGASNVAPPQIDNVFHCPSGIMELSQVVFNDTTVPNSRQDSRGAMASCQTSVRLRPNLNIFTWYGVNACNNAGYKTPFLRCQIDNTGKFKSGNDANGTPYLQGFRKANEVKKAAQMVAIFDGLYGFNYITGNANRINARHNNKKVTNLLFFDGHAESAPTKGLPGGDGVASVNDFLRSSLVNFPTYLWRLDQLNQ